MRLTADCFLLNLKQDLTAGVLLEVCIQFLRVGLAHIIYMLEVIEGITRR